MVTNGQNSPNGTGEHAAPPANVHLWSRDGFNGDICVTARPYPIVAYTEVKGPHAPYRLDLYDLELPDSSDPEALPSVMATSRHDVRLSVSRREARTPFVWRNAEYDEVHFVQEGEFDYVTDFGTLRAVPGDFVCLPRAVTYRVVPVSTPTLRIILETPEQVLLKPPAPFGMVNLSRDVTRADPKLSSREDGPTRLLLKAYDGVTCFTVPRDPLAVDAVIGGQIPVWKLNLTAIQPLTYAPHGGPPGSFAETAGRDLLFYPMSARPGRRPPMHHNADFDELNFYFGGPGAYGALTKPGQLALVPKAVTHWGPEEDVSEGYQAWMLESAGTFRLTPEGSAAAKLMETGQFGYQPTEADATVPAAAPR